MKGKNVSLGLTILIAALLLVQSSMAYPTKETACEGCHSPPPNSMSITTDITSITVSPGESFNVVATWGGGDPAANTAVKWPNNVKDNALFTPTPKLIYPVPSISGSQSFTLTTPATAAPGLYTVRVYVSNGPKFETSYQDIAVTVATASVPVLTTISVSPSTVTLLAGATQVFTAAPKDQNGNPMVVAVSWTSSNTTVGNVDASGLFTASAAGTTTVKAENGTVSGTATITVTAPAPTPVLTTISVSPATANLIAGTTQVFTAAPKDQNGNPMDVAVTWTSSNMTVGNIDASGLFTASAAGTTTVKAENGTVSGTATITVTAPAPTPVLTTISVSPATANLIAGTTQVFTAAPKDQNGNPMDVAVTWTSSNTTVGNVDASGLFSASAAGTTTITAANGSIVSNAVTVTVSTQSTKLIGDINSDNMVDYRDLGMLGACYGLSIGNAGYNANADLNNDGIVNYKDLGMLGAHYGEHI